MSDLVIKRLSVRLPSGQREELRGIRGLLTWSKVVRDDGTPVTQEMATAFCVKYTHDALSQVPKDKFKGQVQAMVRGIIKDYEREGIEQ
jgi:hypothetical protein